MSRSYNYFSQNNCDLISPNYLNTPLFFILQFVFCGPSKAHGVLLSLYNFILKIYIFFDIIHQASSIWHIISEYYVENIKFLYYVMKSIPYFIKLSNGIELEDEKIL